MVKKKNSLILTLFLALIITIIPSVIAQNVNTGIIEYFDFEEQGNITQSQSNTSNNYLYNDTGFNFTTSGKIGSRAIDSEMRLYFNQNPLRNINLIEDEWSISFFTRNDDSFSSTSSFRGISFFENANTNNRFEYYIKRASSISINSVRVIDFGVSSNNEQTMTFDGGNGGIEHIVIVGTGNGEIEFWVNGELDKTENITVTLNPSNFDNMSIATNSSYIEYFDQLITYDRALDNESIQALYNNGDGYQSSFFDFSQKDITQKKIFPQNFEAVVNGTELIINPDNYFKNHDAILNVYAFIDVYDNATEVKYICEANNDYDANCSETYVGSKFSLSIASFSNYALIVNNINMSENEYIPFSLILGNDDEQVSFGDRYITYTDEIEGFSPIQTESLFINDLYLNETITLFPSDYFADLDSYRLEVYHDNKWNYLFEGDYFNTDNAYYELYLNSFTIKGINAGSERVRINAINNYGGTLSDTQDFNVLNEAGLSPDQPNSSISDVEKGDTFIGQFVSWILQLFPSNSDLNSTQKIGYVVVTMLLIGFAVVFAMKNEDGIMNPATIFVLSIVELLLFIFFISIGYIGIGILVFMVLATLALSYFRLTNNTTT